MTAVSKGFAEHVLIGWLVITVHQTEDEDVIHLPNEIRDALVAKKWVTLDGDGVDFKGVAGLQITDLGRGIVELYGAEWGAFHPIDFDEIPEGT